MNRITRPLIVLVMLLAAVGCQAAVKCSADVVGVSPGSAKVTAAPGQRVDFSVKLDISSSWHIYAHADTNFIGVDLGPDEYFVLEDFQAVYPQGYIKEFFGEKVAMIEGKAEIKGSALVPAGMPAGEYPLEFKLTAQACDAKTCLAPAFIPVTIQLEVTEP